MRNKISAFLFALFVAGTVLADELPSNQVSSTQPCAHREKARFKKFVSANVAHPADLLALVDIAMCNSKSHGDAVPLVRPYVGRSTQYSDGAFSIEGHIDRQVRGIGAEEVLSMIIPAAGESLEFGEIDVQDNQSVTIQVYDGACSLEINVRLQGRKWRIHGLSTLC